MMDPHKTLQYPLSTEKSIRMLEAENKLTFIVDIDSQKPEVKKAVEELFDVDVKKVNTMITSKGNKKAYVKLSPSTPAIDIATELGLM